ncbi:D-alanyl-D-alanine carboxypeptidase / D-alanyl-D-alanine-endopeptidase (penicillin-binding protein 4) [Singulisphaera sp. GP187]|uniref:D-alanyl-D-alanine carboxypeptidase/D-alanyl-D-alanine endopeptidase n=1 Tax=Singulisphaera sp. GP187 TaxID=1882752 RepID=UPI00092BC8A9|nr:D-alanyl-D-alanine carboxypeptidase/D-alanyl-D-alanine-endopeptidase [Singulisphaera sp. GP187]SIO16960.1 D-alanyl-D-alanine carboxypeptidase / D-alanyl-D-alanine-endopeptidase (penicillin-binding protein 4) [Singulisphaera sp. GP187]
MAARLLRWSLIVGIGFGAAAVSATARGGEPLEPRVEEILKTKGFEGGHWGILVVDGTTGKTVYEHNADQMFCPASVTKLFSTAAALSDLGADFRFQTPVVRRGEVKDGVLQGDLILVTRGDLCMGGRTGPEGKFLFRDNDHTYSDGHFDGEIVPSDPLAALDHLARAVQGAGIKTITGDVLVDERFFESTSSTGSGPTRVGPTVINDNVIDIVVTPAGSAGEPAEVRLIPETAFASADIQVDTVESAQPPRLTVRAVGPRQFSVRGQLPAGHKPVVKVYEVEEPAAFARTLFIERLRRRGVQVAASAIGDNHVANLPTTAEVAKLAKVAEYTSPPLREYLRVILKVSHNLHASTLPLLIAAHHGERTLAEGLRREGELLKKLGVPIETISFGGGAGGDRADLVTPRATVALLRAMAARPDFPAYDAALPVLGRDGTLAKAVSAESPARGHARAKTGTFWLESGLTGQSVLTSKALAGYMETTTGRPLVFAFFLNEVALDASGLQVSEATAKAGRLLGSLCEVFYRSDEPKTPSPAPAVSGP